MAHSSGHFRSSSFVSWKPGYDASHTSFPCRVPLPSGDGRRGEKFFSKRKIRATTTRRKAGVNDEQGRTRMSRRKVPRRNSCCLASTRTWSEYNPRVPALRNPAANARSRKHKAGMPNRTEHKVRRALCDAASRLSQVSPGGYDAAGPEPARQPPTNAAGICLFECGPEPWSPLFFEKGRKFSPLPNGPSGGRGQGVAFRRAAPSQFPRPLGGPIDHVSSESIETSRGRGKKRATNLLFSGPRV